MISLRDKNISVAYLQIFLKEYFPDARIYYADGTSKVINTKPLKVTGIYDYTTYQVLACYMYATYPNEGYPKRVIWENNETYSSIQDYYYDGDEISHKTADELIDEFISNPLRLRDKYEKSGDQVISTPYIINDSDPSVKIEAIINENITVACAQGHYDIVAIPDRVMSYIFNEVVTPISDRDEVFRVQKLMYNPEKVPISLVGLYDDTFKHNVEVVQRSFIDAYTFTIVEQDVEVEKVELPENYTGFKITGYVDPWTEVLIDG